MYCKSGYTTHARLAASILCQFKAPRTPALGGVQSLLAPLSDASTAHDAQHIRIAVRMLLQHRALANLLKQHR